MLAAHLGMQSSWSEKVGLNGLSTICRYRQVTEAKARAWGAGV